MTVRLILLRDFIPMIISMFYIHVHKMLRKTGKLEDLVTSGFVEVKRTRLTGSRLLDHLSKKKQSTPIKLIRLIKDRDRYLERIVQVGTYV